MITCYSKAKVSGTCLLIFFCAALAAQPDLRLQNTERPRLMMLFEGRIVDLQYDSIGQIYFADWQGARIRDITTPFEFSKTKYLFVDSVGKPLSSKIYDYASPFRGGLASIQIYTDLGQEKFSLKYAIINTKEEEVLPMSKTIKYVHGSGLAVEKRYDTMAVYNSKGNKLAECPYCEVGFSSGLNSFWMMPPNNWRSPEDKVVKLIDLNGKVLYSSAGNKIEQVVNWIFTASSNEPSYQPYYKVTNDVNSIILNRNGKVVIDSIGFSYFMGGEGKLYKNGLEAIVDTNWKELFPFSYGYTSLSEILYGHPQHAMVVVKNNKFRVVDRNNKQLVPLESRSVISYDPVQRLYKTNDSAGHYWYMNLEGDTVVNSLKYQDVYQQHPLLPGFFVKCSQSGLTGYLDEKGKLLIPCRFEKLYYGGKNLLIFFSNNSAGYVDMQGNVKFKTDNVLQLSVFHNGYALCGFKVTDKTKFIPNLETKTDSWQINYQVHHRVIDSTGKFVSPEIFGTIFTFEHGYALVIRKGVHQYVDKHLREIVMPDGSQLAGYFCNGAALAYNARKKTYGLVNEKLKIIVPVIYDRIDLLSAEGYVYTMVSERGPEHAYALSTTCPNIVNGKVKAVLKGLEKTIVVGK